MKRNVVVEQKLSRNGHVVDDAAVAELQTAFRGDLLRPDHEQYDLNHNIKTLEIDPDFAWAYVLRGTARLDQGDLHGAIKDTSDALRVNPRLARAYLIRGLTCGRLGHRDVARKDLEMAFEYASDPHLKARIQRILVFSSRFENKERDHPRHQATRDR